MNNKWFLTLSIICLFFQAMSQQLINERNIYDMPSASAAALSPDGKSLIYIIGKSDPIANQISSKLYLKDLSKDEPQLLIENVSDPKWSPDGKWISFRGSQDGKSGIIIMDPSNKKSIFIAEVFSSNHFLGHPTQKNYEWSPDSKSIAYVSADPNTGDWNIDPNAPKVIERLLYRSRTSFSDNRITKIYVVDIATKTSKLVTNDNFDSHSLSWGADSRSIVYVSNHTGEADGNYNNDLFIVDVQSQQIKQITHTVGTEHHPQWSPDGKYIIYPATIRPINTKDSPPEDTKLYIYNVQNGEVTCLTTNLDERADGPKWASDSKSYYFGFPKFGKRVIYKGTIGSDQFIPVIDERGSAGRHSIIGNSILYSYSSPNQPSEFYLTHDEGKTKTQLTFYSTEWIKDKTLSMVEDFWFKSFDGVDVQGFINYPSNIPEGQKIPVIHRIHGGPHGAFGFGYTDINEILVAKGYAVISINPRGSSGYGQKFSDGTYQAWGGGDYRDLMEGIDYALEKYSFLDEERMGVTGGSYGGFMTNWVVTQTNRYKAAVTSASVSNLISFYGTSLYQDLIETEFNGLPWDNYALLWHFSPMAHVKNVKTPTLLIHGENDIDVPVGQAEEFYIALKKLNVPARFVRYPNEGHGFSQPKNRLHNNQQLLEWFDKYVK